MVDIVQVMKDIRNIQEVLSEYKSKCNRKCVTRDKYFDSKRIQYLQDKIDTLQKLLP